jgi:hypothetical protein
MIGHIAMDIVALLWGRCISGQCDGSACSSGPTENRRIHDGYAAAHVRDRP